MSMRHADHIALALRLTSSRLLLKFSVSRRAIYFFRPAH